MQKIITRVGEKYTTNEGYSIEIVECFGSSNCTIEFDNGAIIKNKEYKNIVKGVIKNPYHKSVFKIGYFGVGKYGIRTHLKIYDTWCGMLERCYSEKEQERRPTYKGCSVDES
jgi:hypothetical protein